MGERNGKDERPGRGDSVKSFQSRGTQRREGSRQREGGGCSQQSRRAARGPGAIAAGPRLAVVPAFSRRGRSVLRAGRVTRMCRLEWGCGCGPGVNVGGLRILRCAGGRPMHATRARHGHREPGDEPGDHDRARHDSQRPTPHRLPNPPRPPSGSTDAVGRVPRPSSFRQGGQAEPQLPWLQGSHPSRGRVIAPGPSRRTTRVSTAAPRKHARYPTYVPKSTTTHQGVAARRRATLPLPASCP